MILDDAVSPRGRPIIGTISALPGTPPRGDGSIDDKNSPPAEGKAKSKNLSTMKKWIEEGLKTFRGERKRDSGDGNVLATPRLGG